MICWAPWSALKSAPLYPPGSSGRRSSSPAAQVDESWAQWIEKPTKSVWARARSLVPDTEVCENFASFHWGDPWPKTLVTSPFGFVVTVPKTVVPTACAIVSGAVRLIRAPSGALVLVDRTVAVSEVAAWLSIVIVWPFEKPAMLPTRIVVSPGLAAVNRIGVGPPVTKTAPLFSRTVFAVATPPQSQPARVNGTHGAGALAPVGVTMFGTVGVFDAETGSVQ